MHIVSDKNEILNSEVSLQEIDGTFGLVMESRGGAKGKSNERNTDYFPALDTILRRLQSAGIEFVNFQLVSANALKVWSAQERAIEIDGARDIRLQGVDLKSLRRKLSRAQQEKKLNSESIGGNPTKRILISANLDKEQWEAVATGGIESVLPITETDIDSKASTESFSPADAKDAKEKVTRAISLRRGQPKFRKSLLEAYDGKCAISGTPYPPLLEAAHIFPYQGVKTNHVTNGILLRADFHTLFDLGLIGISQDYKVVVSSSLKGTDYERYNGTRLNLPRDEAKHPSLDALKSRLLPN